jgi:peptidoglycan hydrolase CwlO-like protein
MGIQGRLKNLQTGRTLTKADIEWLKNKFNQIDGWKDTAVTKFAEIDGLLEQAKTKIIEHEQRIKELEK